MPQVQQNHTQAFPVREACFFCQVTGAFLIEHMEVGQDLIGDGKAGFCPGPLPDNIPVAVVQAEERLQVIAELGVLFHGEKEPVYQEYDGHGRAQVEKTQGNGDGAVHGHGSHGEGIAGGEDGLIPCAGLCAVHEGDHDQSKHDLASDSRKQGLDEEFYAAAQENKGKGSFESCAY